MQLGPGDAESFVTRPQVRLEPGRSRFGLLTRLLGGILGIRYRMKRNKIALL